MGCEDVMREAERLYRLDLVELSMRPATILIKDALKLYNALFDFESNCYGRVSDSIYNYYVSKLTMLLLRYATALEEKGIRDPSIQEVTGYFTPDEKSLARELDRYSKLDPHTVSPERLAEVMVAGEGELYTLVKGALAPQFMRMKETIYAFERERRIRNRVARALIDVYEARARNVVEALKIVLDRNPSALIKLLKEYEEVLLSSAEVRSRFEEAFKKLLEEERARLMERIKALEEEKRGLAEALEKLSTSYAAIDLKALEEELVKARMEHERLKMEYEKLWNDWNMKVGELESLRQELAAKERELMEVAARERDNKAAREALEAEVERLRGLLREYEDRLGEYEELRKTLAGELEALRERAEMLERKARGAESGRAVTLEEALILEDATLRKVESKLSPPIELPTGWGRVKINRWTSVTRGSSGDVEGAPRNPWVRYVYRGREGLFLGKDLIVELYLASVSHQPSYAKKGFDDEPASLADLLGVVRGLERPAASRFFRVTCLYSPTGWSGKAVEYSGALRTGEEVVVLVDSMSRTAQTGLGDDVSEYYSKLCTPLIEAEVESRVLEVVKRLYDEAYARNPVKPYVEVERIAREGGADDYTVLQAVNKLESEGKVEYDKERRVIIYKTPAYRW